MYRSHDDRTFAKRIDSQKNLLNEFLDFNVGIRSKVGSDEIVGDAPRNTKWKKGLVDGNEVLPFKVCWKGKYINVDPSILWSGGFDKRTVEANKIVIRKTGNSIIAAIDRNGFYHLDNHHAAILKNRNQQVSLMYLVSLLNSELMDRYYKIITMSYGRVMAQINLETLENLPIALPSDEIISQVSDSACICEKESETDLAFQKARKKIESLIETIY